MVEVAWKIFEGGHGVVMWRKGSYEVFRIPCIRATAGDLPSSTYVQYRHHVFNSYFDQNSTVRWSRVDSSNEYSISNTKIALKLGRSCFNSYFNYAPQKIYFLRLVAIFFIFRGNTPITVNYVGTFTDQPSERNLTAGRMCKSNTSAGSTVQGIRGEEGRYERRKV